MPELTFENSTAVRTHLAALERTLGSILGHRLSDRHTLRDLHERLLAGRIGVVHTDYQMPFVEEMFERGQFFGPTTTMRPGIPRECHRNSLLLWYGSGGAYRLTTGFAYCDLTGMWVHHSWLLGANDSRIETTVPRDLYCGVVLTDAEARSWLREYTEPTAV